MSFEVAAEAYDRYMGRWSRPLAGLMVDRLDPRPTDRVLDVGCGPGALTEALHERLDVARLAAVEPVPVFVEAVRHRVPGLDVRRATAEDLPFDDHSFDITIAQLVVHFMHDPRQGFTEMARVTRTGGIVAASVWDHLSGPVGPFWEVARAVEPDAIDESRLPGVHEGELEALAHAGGLHDEQGSALTVRRTFATFEEWWQPYLLGVGPAGDFVKRLAAPKERQLAQRLRERWGEGPFTQESTAWCVLARA